MYIFYAANIIWKTQNTSQFYYIYKLWEIWKSLITTH